MTNVQCVALIAAARQIMREGTPHMPVVVLGTDVDWALSLLDYVESRKELINSRCPPLPTVAGLIRSDRAARWRKKKARKK
jgi:hypothetical protein